MTARTLMGLETEYAIGQARPRPAWDRRRVAECLLAAARGRNRPYLPDASGGPGVFLGNGARLYLDRGLHPEYATPECPDPWQAVAYARAGEACLLELLEDAARRTGMAANAVLLRANVDYARTGATWGCHESYLHTCPPSALPAQLVPHLASRIIYTGAGGFNPLAPGLEFTLSPRAWLLTEETSANSTERRGLVHTKDESLSGPGWHRLHLICGESLCSDRAAVLKLGTTALILATVGAGWRPGDGVQLAAPLDALRVMAADPDGGVAVRLTDGRCLTAIAIQRHYLAQVADCLWRGHLPDWAEELCGLWRDQLDALESGGHSVRRGLDWGIKQEIYRDRARQHGLHWDLLPEWSRVLRRLERAAIPMPPVDGADQGAALGAEPRFSREVSHLTAMLYAAGMEWSDVRPLLRLRHELLEADLRFGQLGPGGIFNALAARGVLDHAAGRPVPDPRHLIDSPPATGRARVRGEAVREVWTGGDAEKHTCDWSRIMRRGGEVLDLRDPFCERAAWVGAAQVAEVVGSILGAGV